MYDMAPVLWDIFSDTLYVEPGYLIICSIVKTLGGNVFILFGITSLITSMVYYKAVERIIPQYALLALFIYFSFALLRFEFNTIRHGMMVSFVWLGFTYIPQKKFLRFLMCVIVASSIHLVGLFMIPMYWIFRHPISKTGSVVAILVSFCIGKLPIYAILSKFLLEGSIYSIKYIYYTTEYANEALGLSMGLISYIILLFYFQSKRNRIRNSFYVLLTNSLLFAICTFLILAQYEVFATRFASIFNLSITIIIPVLFDIHKNAKLLPYLIVCVYCLLLLATNLRPNPETGKSQYLPYKTVRME